MARTGCCWRVAAAEARHLRGTRILEIAACRAAWSTSALAGPSGSPCGAREVEKSRGANSYDINPHSANKRPFFRFRSSRQHCFCPSPFLWRPPSFSQTDETCRQTAQPRFSCRPEFDSSHSFSRLDPSAAALALLSPRYLTTVVSLSNRQLFVARPPGKPERAFAAEKRARPILL